MWSVVMLPRLTEGRLKPEDYEELRQFCPIMLDALSRQRIKRTKSQIMARILAALNAEK
jgi:ribosome biogenesis SPOUT family RNA methylase Rps3